MLRFLTKMPYFSWNTQNFEKSSRIKSFSFCILHIICTFSEQLDEYNHSASTLPLRGPSRKFGSKCCIFSYFFYWRKFIFRVRLITCQKIMSLRAREPPQNRVYVCIIGFHSFTLSKLWRRFSQLFVFPKSGSLKRIELSQFLCYRNDSHIKT